MQQWICHIQGLENVFGAREVEKIGRQINGVEDLSVDFAGETLILKADSSDVLKRLEKTLALSGYRLLRKGYLVTSVIHIPGLESEKAQQVVRSIIGSHTQVRKLDIRPLSKLVYLTHNVDFSIKAFICELNNRKVTAHLRNQSFLTSRWQSFAHFSVLLAALFFMFGALIENFHHSSLGTLSCYIASLVITGSLLAKHAFTQLALHRKLTYGFLMLVVTLISISHDLWFEAALLGLSLAVSFMFEERASSRLKQQWSLLKSVLPLFAFIHKENDRVAVPVNKIFVDDIVVVHAGEYVPVDGEIIQGQGIFSAENIIANSETLVLKEKDKVFAGLQLLEGSIEMKVSASFEDSKIHTLLKRLENLQTKITPKQKKIARKLDYLLYGFVAVSVSILVTQYMPNPVLSEYWFEKSLALMVISGSAFVLTSIQFSHLFAYLYAAKNGIYFYEPEVWRDMVKAKSIVLDKSGVITNDSPEVQEVISLASHSTQEILRLAASLAAVSDNVRFQPIVKRATSNDVEIIESCTVIDVSSKFVRAQIKGQVLTLGSQSTIAAMNLLNRDVNNKLTRWQAEGENVFLLANESQILGMITVQDPVRSEVSEFVDFCHHLGYANINLLANDNEDGSRVIASRYGFDEVFADLSEDEKIQCLAKMESQADVISVSNRAELSAKTSVLNNALQVDILRKENQIIFLGKNLLLLPYLFQVSRKLDKRMNRLITLLINIKILTLVAIVLNLLSFGQVIILEFLLAIWVMSSTYKPKDMFAEST